MNKAFKRSYENKIFKRKLAKLIESDFVGSVGRCCER